ncbi:MAG: lysophospholipid acyltransferase family protein [Coraliomargarita sp.]
MSTEKTTAPPLIDLDAFFREARGATALLKPFTPLLKSGLSISELNSIYADVHAQLSDSENDPNFFSKVLKVMGTQFEVETKAYERIPKEGPLIVLSNHPFGGIDGVVLGAMLAGIRDDSKLMGNYLLSEMEGIRGSIINVDPFERADSARSNLSGMRDALRWLKGGGCLGVFPAGEVSAFSCKTRAIIDRPWTDHISQLAKRTQSQILPVYFEGRNSLLFQCMGLLHPRLRTLMLAREFCRKQGAQLQVRIGKTIQATQLDQFESIAAATEYLRLQTYALRSKPLTKSPRKKLRLPFRSASTSKQLQPLAPALPKHRIRAEIEALPSACTLVEHGDYSIYCVSADQIPNTLKEIGRLREETFRAVQEGTGNARDLDEYDDYYLHLFMWDHKEDEIVGAYRIGLIDQIVERYGKQGLYTATLFKFKTGFLDKLSSGIELGRSFICLKYQKKHASLALIWRGIGEFCVRHPKYKLLFGPVSITDAYHKLSKDLMVHYFREHSFDDEMASLVRAKKPPKATQKARGISIKDIGKAITSDNAISAVVSGFEDDEKGIPVLLKHYLKLNGTLLSFNVDPAFSDVIDGLILVDLTKTDPKILQRYMGKDGYTEFINHHPKSEPTIAI